ncbi:MAG: hypothetical protein ACE5KE_07405 [Methanosarcinales archaeon]
MVLTIEEEFVPIIMESLRRETALIEVKINLVKDEILDFEKKYNISSEEFLKKFESGELGDAQDFFEWWGLIRGLKKLKERMQQARKVLEYC